MPAIVLAALAFCAAALAAPPTTLTVDLRGAAPLPSSPRGGIPPDFASFSLEVPTAPRYLTLPNGTARPSFVALMRLLRGAAPGAAGPNIRVGGSSVETSAYVPAGAPLPAGIDYRVTGADFAAYAAAVPLFGGSLTAGLTFANESAPGLAAAHAGALLAALAAAGRESILEGFEIGNEVDLFGQQGLRPPSWSSAAYEVDFAAFSRALAAAGVPPARVQGATYESVGFFGGLDAYMAHFSAAGAGGPAAPLRSISLHEYAQGHCAGQAVSVWKLLEPDSAAAAPHLALMKPHVAAARALGLPVVIGEGNSASCGGVANVSDAFAAALWGLDTMLAHAAAGLARWNFHGGSSGAGAAGIAHYSPIGYADFAADAPSVRPLFYALWAFQAAARGRPHVLNATAAALPAAAADYLSAYALGGGADGAARVVAVHKDGNATAPAAVAVRPRARLAGSATLVRLEGGAAGVFARAGVSFGGQTFDGSEGGVPRGEPVSESVAPNADGDFAFSLAPASAAILTLPEA